MGARNKAKLSNIPVSLLTDLYLPSDRHILTPSHPRMRGRSSRVNGLKGTQTTFRSRVLLERDKTTYGYSIMSEEVFFHDHGRWIWQVVLPP